MEPVTKDLGKVMMTIEGEHSLEREYEVLSVVSSNGISYISKKNVPVNIPITNTEYWQFFGSLGVTPQLRKNIEEGYIEVSYDNGVTWENLIELSAIQGPQGIQGIQGPQGNTGSSVDYPYELVNNVTTNDSTKGLSAAQGVILNNAITNITTLFGEGYLYRGIATPTTNPGTVTGKVFYLATTVGTYEYFNNAVVADGEVRVFTWNGSLWESSLTKLAGIRDINGIKNVALLQTCRTAGDVAAKEITQSGYVPLYNGFQKVIDFSATNTADDCTLSINGETPRPLFLNNTRVSSSNPVVGGRKYILTWLGGANYYLTEFENYMFERVENKVNSVSAQSTDEQYPSAKCVYDNFQIANYANKTVIDKGRINEDGSLNIATSSAFRILGPIDLVLDSNQTFFYKGITITETSSHAQLYYRYLASDGETIVGVGRLKTSELLTIPNNARYLQFGISVNDITSFIVKVSYIQQDNLKSADKLLRFAVFSDLHYGVGGNDAQRVQELYDAVVNEMISSHLDFVIFNGDMVDCHNTTKNPDAEYQYLYENLISKIKCPIFFTLGNHDGVTSVKTLEQYYLKGVQCSMETDMFYFVFLNSYYLGSHETNVPKKWAYDGVDTTYAQSELLKASNLGKVPIIIIHQLGKYSSDAVIDELLANFDRKIVIYSHTHNAVNQQKTGGWYINPGAFLDDIKTYVLVEMTTTYLKSTIIDLVNNTQVSANIFSVNKNESADIVLYKNK